MNRAQRGSLCQQPGSLDQDERLVLVLVLGASKTGSAATRDPLNLNS